MKKTISRLPDSELDIMLVLWNHEPPMGRLEIERVVNEKKKLAPTTILSLLTRLEKKGLCLCEKRRKDEPLYAAGDTGGIPAAGEQKRIGEALRQFSEALCKCPLPGGKDEKRRYSGIK